MTDPTKQAATAKTARETIAAHYETVEKWFAPDTLERAATDWGTKGASREVARTALALRALLDAPEGGVQRLCEAGESLWREVLELLNYANGKRDNITPRLEEILCDLTKKSNAHFDALAALRASPESVGGAAPSGRAAQAINTAGRIVREAEAERDNAQRTASSLSVELAVAAKERDALKADLAAARGEVERMRAEIAGDSHTCANGTVRPYPSVVCSLCVSRGITPPPATEAPISERARLVYEGAVKFAAADPCAEEDSTPYVLGKHDRRAEFIAKYVEVAAEILAAAERTVKAPQAEG